MKPIHDILLDAITRLLKPLARILLRHNISFLTFSECAKRVFVEVAEHDFPPPGRKQSLSRIAMLTGLSRKEVLKIKRVPLQLDGSLLAQQSRAVRVINGWTHDPVFLDSDNKPLILNIDGEDPGFATLVRRHSGDIPVRAVLDELLRIGLVELTGENSVRLISPVYVPRSGINEKLAILGIETADLLNAIDHNIHAENTDPFFQRKVCYYHFPERHLPELKKMVNLKSQALLEELNTWLDVHDKEERGSDEQGRRVGVSIYYFEDPEGEDHAPHTS